eukprot:scaffold17366_cov182-Amphora_coffeaeformis.AAC.5
MTILRAIAAFAGLGVFLMGVFMITKGIEGLDGSINEAGLALIEGQKLMEQAAILIENYSTRQQPLLERVQTTRQAFNGWCPNVRETICEVNPITQDLTDNCNFEGIPLAQIFQDIQLPNLESVTIFEDLEDLVDDLRDWSSDLNEYEESIEDVEWPFQVAKAFAVIVILLDTFLMICLIRAWRQDLRSLQQSPEQRAQPRIRRKVYFKWVQKWMLVPLFVTFVLLCLVFSTVFTVASVTTADFCFGGPDDKILTFIDTNTDSKSEVIPKFITYYVERCPPEAVALQFYDFIAQLDEVFNPIVELLDSIRDSRDDIQEICGGELNVISETAEILLQQLCLIRNTVIDVGLFFSCENWYPLYDAVAHRAVCSDAATGFHWLATTQFLVVLFAMILLTVRAGLYEMERPGDETNCVMQFIRRKMGYGNKHRTDVGEEAVAHDESENNNPDAIATTEKAEDRVDDTHTEIDVNANSIPDAVAQNSDMENEMGDAGMNGTEESSADEGAQDPTVEK